MKVLPCCVVAALMGGALAVQGQPADPEIAAIRTLEQYDKLEARLARLEAQLGDAPRRQNPDNTIERRLGELEKQVGHASLSPSSSNNIERRLSDLEKRIRDQERQLQQLENRLKAVESKK